MSTLLTKLSLLFLYRRFFSSTSSRLFWTLWWVSVIYTITYSIPVVIISIFRCTPVESSWMNVNVSKRKCINLAAFFLAQACLNAVSDLGILATPTSVIWKRRMSGIKRAGVAGVFVLGAL